MGRKIDLGTFHKCFLCDYEIRALKLHFKYSHPDEVFEEQKEDRLRCSVCKKKDCKMH